MSEPARRTPPPHERPAILRRALCAIIISVGATAFVNVLPALVGILASGLGLNDGALGSIASAGLAGSTLGGIVGIATARKFAVRAAVRGGLAILGIANIASALVDDGLAIAFTQFIGGAAGAVALAGCLAVFSYSDQQRNFGAFLVAQMIVALAGVSALRPLAETYGWRSAFFALAAFAIIVLPFAHYLPAEPHVPCRSAVRQGAGARTPLATWFAVAGVAVDAFGASAPNATVYAAAISVFMFAWPLFIATQFAALAAGDAIGTATLSFGPATNAAFALGPVAAGALFVAHGFQALQLMAIAGVVLALFCAIPAGLRHTVT